MPGESGWEMSGSLEHSSERVWGRRWDEMMRTLKVERQGKDQQPRQLPHTILLPQLPTCPVETGDPSDSAIEELWFLLS